MLPRAFGRRTALGTPYSEILWQKIYIVLSYQLYGLLLQQPQEVTQPPYPPCDLAPHTCSLSSAILFFRHSDVIGFPSAPGPLHRLCVCPPPVNFYTFRIQFKGHSTREDFLHVYDNGSPLQTLPTRSTTAKERLSTHYQPHRDCSRRVGPCLSLSFLSPELLNSA